MAKKALITGITGQDGSYLTELLLEKGYEVHGIVRMSSSFNRGRIDHIYRAENIRDRRLFLHYGDMTDTSSVTRILEKSEPDEIYNLAAQSHVRVSFDIPEYTAQVDALGTLRMLDIIKKENLKTRFYQASTSELYGATPLNPQNEKTPFYPRSPYGVAKLYSYWLTVNYREAYGIFASNGILFNHESPRRGESFVTRKITLSVARIHHGLQRRIQLGNLNAVRDWGYAPEFVEGMWRMLQHSKADDFVLATGVAKTVREFATAAFAAIGRSLRWEGQGLDEKGVCQTTGDILVEIDPTYFRPTEVDLLIGNSEKAERLLGWKAATKFEDLVRIMVDADVVQIGKQKTSDVPVFA